VGIPMLPGESSSVRADLWIAGLGIGGISYAMNHLDALIFRGGLTSPPSTALYTAVPWLAGIPDIPAGAIAAVLMLGLPTLIVAGLTPRWSSRALLGAAVVTLVALAWWSAPIGDSEPAQLMLRIAGIVVLLVAIVAWGGVSAWSWIVAALSYQGFGRLRDVVYSAEWQGRAGGALGVLVATILILLIVRFAPATQSRQ